MAITLSTQEKMLLQGLVITYSEYEEAIDGSTFSDEHETDPETGEELPSERELEDAKMPDGFVKYQKKALALFRKVISQVQVIPRNRIDYLDLRPQMGIESGSNIYHTESMNYQENFRNALAEQIKFMYENEIIIDNGYLNSMNGFGVGSYHQAGNQGYTMNKVFRGLHPSAYDYLEQMGGMNMCINHPLRVEDFYKGEH